MDAFLDWPTAAISMILNRVAPRAQLHTMIEWISIYIAMLLWFVVSSFAYIRPVGFVYMLGITYTHTPLGSRLPGSTTATTNFLEFLDLRFNNTIDLLICLLYTSDAADE